MEKVESHQDAATAPVRLYYTGWSSSTGEADWGLRPLFAGDKTPPSMYNISYYKNPTVDADIMKALGTTDRAEKTKLYTEVQEEIWKDAPWAFLVTEKLLYATSKKLTGMYVMPDANYFFEESICNNSSVRAGRHARPVIPPFGEVSTDAPLFSQTPPRVAAHTVFWSR